MDIPTENTDETSADRRLHPATIILRFLKRAPSTLLGLPAFIAVISKGGFGIILPVMALAAILSIVYNYLKWKNFRFGVGAQDIVIESGILNRTRRSIPFSRIQDIGIERGPVERILGLARVQIETGGSEGDEGLLDSLSMDDAQWLRSAVRHGGATPQTDTTESETVIPPIFAMDVRRVLLSGIFNFSLLFIAGIYAVLNVAENWLPFRMSDIAEYIGFHDGRLETSRFTPGMIVTIAFIALFMGIVAGVVRTVTRDYGFTLTVEKRGFRRERGLLTRREDVIPKARVQLARLRTGIIRRAFGWWSLGLQTLHAGGSEDGENKQGRQDVAPFATLNEIAPILYEAGGLQLPPDDALLRVSGLHPHMRHGIYIIPVAAICISAYFNGSWLLWLLSAVPVAMIVHSLKRRFHRYALIDDTLYVRRGLGDQSLWIVPIKNTQSISISRTWLQRKLGLSSLLVDTAGASYFGNPRISDLRADIAVSLKEDIKKSLYKA